MSKRPRIPGYLRHKATGQARARPAPGVGLSVRIPGSAHFSDTTRFQFNKRNLDLTQSSLRVLLPSPSAGSLTGPREMI